MHRMRSPATASAACLALLALCTLLLDDVRAQPVSNLMTTGRDNALALFPDAPTAWSDNARRTAHGEAAAGAWSAHCPCVWVSIGSTVITSIWTMRSARPPHRSALSPRTVPV